MKGIGLLFFSCVMFIHLGLGDTLCRLFKINFILFKCVKCLTFWSILSYSLLIVKLGILESVSISFLMAYMSLWTDLGLSKIAERYDNWYKKIEEGMESDGVKKD